MNEYFKTAKPVWAEGLSEIKNVTCVFGAEFVRADCATLKIAACNFYRVFLNGKFAGYGPARAPHGFCRVDEYRFTDLRENNRIVIEVAGYNCNSFYALNERPFLQAELVCGNRTVATGAADGFTCKVSHERIRKCPRYSYQRPFTECYDFTLAQSLQKVAAVSAAGGTLLPRGVSYPEYREITAVLVERGGIRYDEALPVYRNRCLVQESIGLYPLAELEVNPNEYLSRLTYEAKAFAPTDAIDAGEYAVYDLGQVKSGFIGLELSSACGCELYVIFDETDSRLHPAQSETMDISYNRNDSLNFVYAKCGAGERAFLTFEPYCLRYVKVIVQSGKVRLKRAFVTEYETPDSRTFRFACADKGLEKVVDAAKNTFAQNVVDLPMDCPGRERAGWLCDAYFTSQAEKLFTGKNTAERNFLENYVLGAHCPSLPKNMIGMCWPADFEDGNYIPNWAMWYVVELCDYVCRSGDTELAEKSKSVVYGLTEYFEKYRNAEGLLENLDGWIFIEWSGAGDAAFVRGVSFPSNMLYAQMLDCAAQLYGDDALAKQADSVRAAVRTYSYNGEFFEDNAVRENGGLQRLGHISETCQYYAFFSHTATKENYPALWQKLIGQFGPDRDVEKTYTNICKSVPFIGNYLRLIMLMRAQEDARILDECKAFFLPMAERTGTLWEHGALYASLNHGFASFAANLIVAALTGFVGVNEKDKTVSVRRKTPVCAFSLTLPLACGEAVVESDGKRVSYVLPPEYKLQFAKN